MAEGPGRPGAEERAASPFTARPDGMSAAAAVRERGRDALPPGRYFVRAVDHIRRDARWAGSCAHSLAAARSCGRTSRRPARALLLRAAPMEAGRRRERAVLKPEMLRGHV